jgi:hypothetical protein
VGVLAAMPLFITLQDDFPQVTDKKLHGAVTYGVTFGAFGLGVFIAYLVDHFLSTYKGRQNGE